MNPCADKNQNPTFRCPICDINWSNNLEFEKCGICGEKTSHMCVDDEVMTYDQAKKFQARRLGEIKAKEAAIAAEAADREAKAEAAKQRAISAAVAAFEYDWEHSLNAWLAQEGDVLW